jgi:hypothetical protein
MYLLIQIQYAVQNKNDRLGGKINTPKSEQVKQIIKAPNLKNFDILGASNLVFN